MHGGILEPITKKRDIINLEKRFGIINDKKMAIILEQLLSGQLNLNDRKN